MIKKTVKLILIIFWMGLIFSFSSDNADQSNKKSDGIIITMVEAFYGRDLSIDEKDKWINYLVVPVRKGAHFSVYLVLGLLIFSFLLEFMKNGYKSILLSIGISFLYACSDEIHQLFVPGRSGNILDVLIDTVGASVGVLVFSFIVRKCCKYEQKERTC